MSGFQAKNTTPAAGPAGAALPTPELCAHLANIIECSDDAILSKDLSGRITTWNKGAERIFGYSAAEVVGKPVSILIPPDLEKEELGILERIKRGERIDHYETLRARKNGNLIHVSLSVSPIRDAAGRLVGASKIARDITNRKQSQEEGLRAKQEWERTFDSVPDLIAIIDNQHRIVRVNRAMAARLGQASPVQCVGLTCYQCIHGLDQPPDFCPHALTLQDGQEHVAEFYEKNLGGFFQVTTTPLFNERGAVLGSVHVARDISNRKAMEESLRENKQLLETVLNHTHMLVACLDREFNFLVVNRAYAQADGQAPDFFPGKNHFALYPHPENKAIFRRVVETGQPYFAYGKPFAYARNPERGTSFWDWGLIPIKDDAGRVSRVVLTLLDVTKPKLDEAALRQAQALLAQANQNLEGKVQERTAQLEELNRGLQNEIAERKRAEQALRQSEQRFQAIFNATYQFIGLLDPQGTVLEMNHTALEFVGTTAAAVVRSPFWEGPWWSHSPALQEWLKGAITQAAHGKFIRHEVEHIGADGTRHVVDFSLKPVLDEQGEVVLLIPEGRDITERKQAEQALRETVTELEAFSYTVSHDLRAPLRSMRMFSSLLLDTYGGTDPTAEDYAIRINRSAQRMDNLITDILAYSHLSRTELPLKPVDAVKLLRDMIDTYPELQPGRAQIAIVGEIPLLLANQAALTQCCSNLLGNAVKFVAPETMPQVRIWAEPKGEFVRLWFEDNGIGIDQEYREKVFGIFERLHPEYEGTGIGLAIVRKAVERMGGKVGVESEEGKGSRFWLELKPADPGESSVRWNKG